MHILTNSDCFSIYVDLGIIIQFLLQKDLMQEPRLNLNVKKNIHILNKKCW